MAIVANVLNSEVFNSEGSKSSTKSLRQDFSSRQKLLLISFNSIIKEYKNVRISRPLLNQRKSNLIYLTQKVFSFYLMDNFNNKTLQ